MTGHDRPESLVTMGRNTQTEDTFKRTVGEGKLDRLIYVLRGLGWPVKSYAIDDSTLSYFIGDADKTTILEGDE